MGRPPFKSNKVNRSKPVFVCSQVVKAAYGPVKHFEPGREHMYAVYGTPLIEPCFNYDQTVHKIASLICNQDLPHSQELT